MKNMVDGFEEMMSGSLGLEEPWYIEKAEFDPEEPAMHIYVKIRDKAKISCPKCGGESKRYGYEKKKRTWRHGNIFFVYPSYVHCQRPKVLCPHCGTQQISAPFERKNSRFTLLFEGIAMMLLPDAPVSKVASWLNCDEKSLVRIMRYWVNKSLDKRTFETVKSLAIDETSFKKGHKYVTLMIDAIKRAVVDVEPGKDGEAVDAFAEKLNEKGGNPELITAVTSDLSRSFVPAIERNFPNAEHTIDKFHIKQLLIKALDDVRKDEQKKSESRKSLFLGRRLFMIPQSKLTDEQSLAIQSLSKSYPKTGRAYRIVAALDDFYASRNIDEADKRFDALVSWMRRCRLQPMKDTAETLKRYKEKILNFFKNRLTNAICEGLNSLVQAAKRKARGYHTFEGFSTMIYLVAGKLDLDLPFAF